jgi:short-subunit dehydrogenase
MQTPSPTAGSDASTSSASVVVITGASSGIGRSTAAAFARRGWKIGLIARGHAGLEATRNALLRSDATRSAASVASACADVSDPVALEAAAAQLEAALGAADVWVNCAGNGTFGRFLDSSPEEFKRVTDVTYMGSVNGTRAALMRMLPRDQGCIVNVCSAVAFHGMPLLSSYSGAKHALRGFDQSVRAELAQDGRRVRLTTVFPPAVNTPFFDHAVSHMRGLGRPMAPVYQPHVIAEAIYLAATTRRHELLITFTTTLFAVAVRLMPGIVRRAIHRLGYEGQLNDDPHAKARHKPTLFAPSETASASRGAFDSISRARSAQVSLLCWLADARRSLHRRLGFAPRPTEPTVADTTLQGTSTRQTPIVSTRAQSIDATHSLPISRKNTPPPR